MNPYEPEVDWFTRDLELHPLSSAPEPKRRFLPSKWEEKKCVPPDGAAARFLTKSGVRVEMQKA